MATAATAITQKPRCKYWGKCYRKDVAHKKNFIHPGDEEEDSTLLGKLQAALLIVFEYL